MNEKIGIIIPSYNQGKYLERTILSVLGNSQNANIQIALIDGGSTDNTWNIIRKYKKYFTVWCSEPDNGQAAAINKGIRLLPECQYYMWLNSDDVFETDDSVKKILDFAIANKYEVCYGLSHFIDEDGNIIGDYPVEKFDYAKLGNRCYLSQPSVLFSKKAYDMTGPLNEELKMCLDYEYWIRLGKNYPFGFLNEYIGATRIYGETKTSTMQQRHLLEAITILDYYYKKVPMHWVITKILVDHPDTWIQKVPRRVLMCLLYPMKNRVIKECKEGNTDVKNAL